MFQRAVVFGAAIAALCLVTPAQVVGDFECQSPGQALSSGPDCEGWTSSGGFVRVLPNGGSVTGPCGGFPSSGSQWLDINALITGPASPVVPPSTPGVWPFLAGTVAEARVTATLPSTGGAPIGISLDWFFMTTESANGGGAGRDDFAQVVVADPMTNTVITTVMYVDTYPPFVLTPNSCPNGVGAIYSNGVVASGSATATIPGSFSGQSVIISAVCASQSDNGNPSCLFLDNVKIEGPAAFPGSADDLTMATAVGLGSLPTGGAGNETKQAQPADVMVVQFESPMGTYDLFPPVILGQSFVSGMPPMPFPMFPELHMSPTSLFVLLDGARPTPFGPTEVILPGGNTHLYTTPSGVSGFSVILQTVVVTAASNNGFFAITDGYVFEFIP